jgi:GNAT superfamily N-acetyltransferase
MNNEIEMTTADDFDGTTAGGAGDFEVRELTTSDEDIDKAYPILHQLRDHLTKEDFAERYRETFEASAYRIIGVWVGDELRAIAGFRFILNMAVGNALYIDDLVVSSDYRSNGYGAVLVKYLEGVAIAIGVDAIRLDSAVHRLDAHRFYEREGFYFYSKHFGREL